MLWWRQRGWRNSSAIDPTFLPPVRAGLGLRPAPRFGFAKKQHDRDDEERRQDADEEQHAPSGVAPQQIVRTWLHVEADQRPDDVAEGGKRLQRAERDGPHAPWNALSDERRGRAEHSADAKSDQEPIDGEVDPAGRKSREAGESRIDEERRHHRLHASPAVAHHPEENAAGSPAENHRGGRVGADRAHRVSRRRDAKELAHRRLARQNEQPLVHAVEQPAGRRDDDDEPVSPRDGVVDSRANGAGRERAGRGCGGCGIHRGIL